MKQTSRVQQRPNWLVVGGAATVVALVFLWPFLPIISIAAVLAYTFLGVHRWLERYISTRLAAVATFILSILTVVIPLVVLLGVAIAQGVVIAKDLATSANSAESLPNSLIQSAEAINLTLASVVGNDSLISISEVEGFVRNALPDIIRQATAIVIGVASSVPFLMTSVIIYVSLFISFLRYHRSIRQTLIDVSPFSAEESRLFIGRMGATIRSSLIGQFVLALLLGVAAALLMIPLGLGKYFFFFAIIYSVLNLVPLGSGIIVIPLGIVTMLSGQFWLGFWILAIYILGVCNLDNLLRPRLMSKRAKLLPAVTMLSTFCGLYYFGILGIVYGPLIAIALLTTLETYRQHAYGIQGGVRG